MDLTKIIPQNVEGGFIMPNGTFEKYDNFKVLTHTIDTIRQFYECRLKKTLINKMANGSFPREIVINETPYTLSKMGSNSGFQYSFQSKKLGLQVLFKSFTKKLSQDANHIKTELSPHFLVLPYDVQHRFLQDVISYLTHFDSPVHFAIHFAIDFQVGENYNYVDQLFPDLAHRIKGFRANSAYTHEKLSFSFDHRDFSFSTNGRKGYESITMGSPTAFQFTIYRKDLEIIHSNKVEFFSDLWGDQYDSSQPVFRLELRIHQEVVKTYNVFEKYYLDYMRNSDFSLIHTFITKRLRYMDETKTVLSPIWFLLVQSLHDNKLVSRVKPKKDSENLYHNSSLALGNLLTGFFKIGLDANTAFNSIMSMREFHVFLYEKFHIIPYLPDSEIEVREALLDYIIKKHEQFILERN